MTKRTKTRAIGRRDFLKMAAATAPAAAVALTGEAVAADTLDQHAGEGLRETAHTRGISRECPFLGGQFQQSGERLRDAQTTVKTHTNT